MNKMQIFGLTLVCICGLNGAAAGGAPTGAVYPYDRESFGPYRENPDQFMMDLNTVLYDGKVPEEITPERFIYILESIAEQRREGRLENLPEEFNSIWLNMVLTPYP